MDGFATVPARVALFHGWAGSPVWYRTPDEYGPVDLAGLPISDGLRDRLLAWDLHADTTLSTHDYAWPDADTEARFTAAGSVLAQELRAELGIEVIYTPDGDEDTRPDPPEPLPGHVWTAYAPLSDEWFGPVPPAHASEARRGRRRGDRKDTRRLDGGASWWTAAAGVVGGILLVWAVVASRVARRGVRGSRP